MTRLIRNRIDGVAEPLPEGERILWSAKPDQWIFTRRLMRLDWVFAWFAALSAGRAYFAWSAGGGMGEMLIAASGQLPLALFGLGLLSALGIAMARSTSYVVSSHRVVLQVGVALPITFNVPLRFIDSVAIRTRKGKAGDVILTLCQGANVKALALWPHSQGWRHDSVQPLMRDISESALNELKPILAKVLEASQQEEAQDISGSAHPKQTTYGLDGLEEMPA
jgi:hypothetical protein